MSENCRLACGKCGVTRAITCSGGEKNQGQFDHSPSRVISTTTAAPLQRPPPRTGGTSTCNSPMCFNEYQCCPVWALQGECQTKPVFMLCQCRVSCQQCRPPYRYGDCADYHSDCAKWSRTGECRKPWMLENCRRSCNSCATIDSLRPRCTHRFTRTVFFTSIGM
ncbi:hypothetical protein GCK32_016067 [Trichostrongylus colubriformis]|uniref:ShKT domain-containing protein n=1 Tax=Trichostrongylus colubriformis TaxID=6319 RepID=A0AAN8IST9_TRICO